VLSIKRLKNQRVKDRFFSFVLSVISTLLLCGLPITISTCGKTDEPVSQTQKETLPKNKAKQNALKGAEKHIEDKTTGPNEDKYSYDATGKPDPFVSLITETPARQQGIPEKQTKPLTPLQKYDLKELKLVAIIKSGDNSSALLEDSLKYGYIVNEGMLIGKNDGVIKKITENGLVVEEKFYNSIGEIETKISTLTIQHQE
jgi:type IV pilus assembly protein PilP